MPLCRLFYETPMNRVGHHPSDTHDVITVEWVEERPHEFEANDDAQACGQAVAFLAEPVMLPDSLKNLQPHYCRWKALRRVTEVKVALPNIFQ